jgi:hypothetical protein
MTDDASADAAVNFQWPDDPPPDWWLAKGAALGLSPEQVRFTAAMDRLGPAERENSLAARLAGLSLDRTRAFRLARSVAVRKLLDEVKKTRDGLRPRVSEQEIDEVIDNLIRSADAKTAAQGIELREKRTERQRQRGDGPADDGFSEWRWCRNLLGMQNGASAFMLLYRAAMGSLGHPGNYPLLHDVHHVAMQEVFGPAIWDWCCQNLNVPSRAALDKQLADTGYQLAARKQIWSEVGQEPPGPAAAVNGKAQKFNGGAVEGAIDAAVS